MRTDGSGVLVRVAALHQRRRLDNGDGAHAHGPQVARIVLGVALGERLKFAWQKTLQRLRTRWPRPRWAPAACEKGRADAQRRQLEDMYARPAYGPRVGRAGGSAYRGNFGVWS